MYNYYGIDRRIRITLGYGKLYIRLQAMRNNLFGIIGTVSIASSQVLLHLFHGFFIFMHIF